MENNFHELLLRRHSIRKYTGEDLSADDIKTILEAGLLAPTSKNARSWSFTVVDDTATLEQLAKCKPMFATPIARCKVAIVVSGNPEKSDVWIEDTAIAAAYMQLQVEALGLGSCWINRAKEEFESDEGKALLRQWGIEGDWVGIGHCILGYPAADPKPAAPRKPDYIVKV